MTDPRQPAAGTTRGATSVGPQKKRKGLWLALALAAAVIALLLLLSQCGGDDDPQPGAAGASSSPSSSSSSASASPSSSASSSPSATSSAGGGAAGGAAAGQPSSLVAADGTAVLDPAAPADPAPVLGQVAGQQVTATAVQVLSVPADEGFWVGSSDAQRVWVQLAGAAGESPYQVRQGDRVDFTGTVTAHDGQFPATVGVDDAEGAAQLATQAQHVEADRSTVQLSS
ncbi:hypothetical protein O2W14_04785 [Modestobacter sp. VKM Ac-2986]|uniref:hypothetical protein n=1 Tax=Modestobacter sp. VKM Ac-2986 TaxID=3004140 RepID=UPI0022AA3273|nr:hypothetical protein [Modestobacter sp. VKM Ac-2986]MCZ2828151.1 hypothetical protein [Modestobacter sp. VKM Ac-2986]